MIRLARFLSVALLLPAAAHSADPIPVKVAVVVTFEVGADRGDRPGEFQFWAERENWTQSIQVPGVDHPVGRHRNDRRRLGDHRPRVQPDHGARPEREI